ncbi:MAG TPA: response regulator [Syntrophorhabdaceae bacterium]|nr:response regulator [Syntrophorhabdaceae bacterium]
MAILRKKHRILIIDDDELIGSMVQQMLHRMGYVCVTCKSPLQAWTLFSHVPERFDAIMVDEIMPEIRGTQLASRLLEVRGDIPIILMTGHGDRITLDQLRDSGIRATLIKPIIKEWLQSTLARVLPKQPGSRTEPI